MLIFFRSGGHDRPSVRVGLAAGPSPYLRVVLGLGLALVLERGGGGSSSADWSTDLNIDLR